jgi:membrane-bound lytic murein transglycosylase D
MKPRPTETATAPPLKVRARSETESQKIILFRFPFRIGRGDDCEVSIKNDFVSRIHAEVVFENDNWCIRDLNSSNGLYLDGRRVEQAAITRPLSIRLGVEGPEVFFEPQAQAQPAPPPVIANLGSAEFASGAQDRPRTGKKKDPGSGTMLRHYVDHYFSKSATNAAAGEHTLYVRRAFAKVQKQQKRRYGQIIAIVVLLALGAGGYALYERRQLQKQRALAEDLFYTMKSLDLDIANLEKAVAASGNQHEMQMVRQDSSRRREMENTYDQYLAALHVYDRKMTEQQRIMLRIARIFGECELDMPSDFEAEVNKYIKYWQHSGRLATAIRTAQRSGYAQTISRELLAQGLPPQFFYLALQESNFDPYVSGPMTRKGIAKGMWQFVPETAIKYGLRVGPLVDLRRPDPGDERDQYQKATKAAARYLKDLYTTDAQASGILVMACYNWGENQVLPLVRSLPANPRERNFWRLLTRHRDRIPKETYDYVFYIVSAAVIGENPRLFGFDFDNPLSDLESHDVRRPVDQQLPE